MSDAAIRQCIREVLTGVLEGVRGIPVDTLREQNSGESDYAQAVASMVMPEFELTIGYVPTPTEQVIQPSSLWIEGITLRVRTVYKLDSAVLTPARIGEVRSRSADIGKQIRTLFKWPGTLEFTATNEPTGIAGGVMEWGGMTTAQDANPANSDQRLYTTDHNFTGWIVSTEEIIVPVLSRTASAGFAFAASDVGNWIHASGAGAQAATLPDLSASLTSGREMVLSLQQEGAATAVTITPSATSQINGAGVGVAYVCATGRTRTVLCSRDGLAWFTG
ncbi:MAG: hypothetical protein WC211_00835 [Dehalococcoidia bacterium]